MTAQEAREKYGNSHDGYVSCYECPIYDKCQMEAATGRSDCWEEIAKQLTDDFLASTPDNVNHPKHYETGKYECIDVMVEAIGCDAVKGFCLCNAFKYIYRCTNKHETPTEDVKKAVWYLNKFLELEG